MSTALAADLHRRSPFAGADICREAGFALPDRAARAVFEDDLWDFTEVIGLPVQMAPHSRRFHFTAIDPGWRLVAKELILALLAPRHDAVALLPRAYRVPVHLRTASARLVELTWFMTWLTERGITALGDLDSDHCAAYLAHRRYLHDDAGVVVGQRGPATRRAAAQIVVDLVNYAPRSPPTVPPPTCGPGPARPPPRSRRCPAAEQ